MPYTMKSEGLKELSDMLDKMEKNAGQVASLALYDGAGAMADEIRKQAKNIKTAPFKYAAHGNTRLPSPEEKEIVENADVGIAKFNGSGTEVNTSVGYKNAGYTILAGKLKPVPMIVASVNSGTSFMKKQPFFRKAVSNGTKKATEAMIRRADEVIKEMTK